MRRVFAAVGVCALPALLLSVALAAELSDAGKETLAKLQGDWQAITIEREGVVDDQQQNFPLITVEGDKVLLNHDDVGLRLTALDPTASPALVNFEHEQTSAVLEGIYTLTDDTWQVCVNIEGHGIRERPTKINANDHAKFWTITYKRPGL